MSITDERLRQIAELEDKIEKKIAWINDRKDELKKKTELVKDVPQDLINIMSKSASRSSGRRGQGETLDIDESATRDEEIIDQLGKEIKKAKKELEELKKEKRGLEDYKEGA